jgi:tRNA(Ile)-lysidine synthase TilS/MesJ
LISKSSTSPRSVLNFGLDVLLVPEGLLRRGEHRLLERLHDDLAVDALLLAHLLDDTVQIRLHERLLQAGACGVPAGRLKS